MTAADTVLVRVLEREGGIADVGDGKGVTRFGQTEDWLRAFGLTAPATREQALANYQAWLTKTKLDQVCTVLDSLSDVMVDWAVHSGEGPAIRSLQAALVTRPDGVIGPVTLALLASALRGHMARRVLADRVRFIGRIITEHPERHARFAKGWANRVAYQIEFIA